MKKAIRLTESDLHRIVKESVNRVLNEIGGTHPSGEGNYALALDAARKARALGREQQAANFENYAQDYFNDRYGTENFGMDQGGQIHYAEPDFQARYSPDQEVRGLQNNFNKAQENYSNAYNNFGGGNEKTAKLYNDYDFAKRQYQRARDNNAEIVRRGSALKAYPRKKTMGGIKSYQNFRDYLQNTPE